jgi:hypothetical protein
VGVPRTGHKWKEWKAETLGATELIKEKCFESKVLKV